MIIGTFIDARRIGLSARSVYTLLGLQLGGTVMELLGLAAIVPVFQFVQADGDVGQLASEHAWWERLIQIHDFLGFNLSLASLLAITMFSLILRQSFVYVRLVYQARVREGILSSIRARGFSHFLGANLTFQERDDSGRIVNDLTTELTRSVENVFSGVTLMGYAIIFAAYVVTLLVISGTLTMLALAIFGLATVAVRRLMYESEVVGKEVTAANSAMSSFLVERLKHSRLIRLAGTEKIEAERMHSLTEQQRDRNVRIFTLLASLDVIIEPLVIGGALIFVHFSIEWLDLSLETVGLFLVLVVRLLPVVKEATRVRQSRRGTRASFEAVVSRLAETEAAQEEDEGGESFKGVNTSISFRDVSFCYQGYSANAGGAIALQSISFEVRAGQITALVGPSGAGKSTLVDLLPRLRLPQAGRIAIDGNDILKFSLQSLRKGIAYAPQSPQIFNVPLAEHIRYGRPKATMEEVRRAAELANAAAFIEAMADGYASLAGDGGGRLSGGQRQRLDLARALVSRAPILILDEPTSALDADSELLFRNALERIRRETNITVIVIAHRLSTVTIADKIVVLQNGRVVAEGSHDQLIGVGGWYREAFHSQQSSSLRPVVAG